MRTVFDGRLTRPAVAASLAISLALAGAASAAPGHLGNHKKQRVKPVCNLVTDATGDAKTPFGQSDPSLDIVSADVATNAKWLTAVIRVAKLSTGTDSLAPLGRWWALKMDVPGSSKTILTVGVVTGPFGTRDADNIGGKARLDAAHNAVVISEPLSVLNSKFQFHIVPRKSRLTDLVASATAVTQEPYVAAVNTTFLGYAAGAGDQGPGAVPTDASYLAGTRSCVKVGS